jgi:cysteinyl-tRNA synthetase
MLHLFDTAKGGVVPFEPRDPGKVSMYVCGPTVYGPPHLGHGRFSLVFDVLRRYLEWSGNEVTYVSNITDVDDNIINRARTEGRSEGEVAAEYEAVWWEAMDAIGVKRPTVDPHATAYVEQMVELVTRLVDHGIAYETSDGVYFQAERVEDYGLLARQSLDSLRAGARVETSEEKRSPVDFALWKKAAPDELSWPSPWGPGRPGWHTECVVMALDLLGDGFDIHGGGQDLAFPHHENERAQSAADGRSFARYWVHNGFVEVEGEKMSKSLGNFTNLMDLIARADPRSYRLLVLRSHYRSPVEINETSVGDAVSALERLDAFARRTRELAGEPDAVSIGAFREAMDRDMDTPAVSSLLFDLVRRGNSLLDQGDEAGAAPLAAAVREIAGAVGLELRADAHEVPADVADLARQRDEARAAKDWATADALRDELQARGWVVEDGPTGTVVRRP